MKLTRLVALSIILLTSLTAYPQKPRTQVLEGVVSEAILGNKGMLIYVDSGGARYEFSLINLDFGKDVVGEDATKVGTHVRVTYTNLRRSSVGVSNYYGTPLRVISLTNEQRSGARRPVTPRGSSSETGSDASSVPQIAEQSQVQLKAQLRRELNQLHQAALKKIDDDVESVALGFASSASILRDLRVAYTAKTVLDTLSSSFGIISSSLDVATLKDSARIIKSPIEYAGLMMAVHGAIQNGEQLAFVFDKNRYLTNVSRMLETADATQSMRRFDSLRYKNSIKQSLDGGNGVNIIIMPHHEPREACQTVQPRGARRVTRASIKGLAELRRYLTAELQRLEEEIAIENYTDQQTTALMDLVSTAKRALIESKLRSTSIRLTVPASLASPFCEPTTTQISLGRIAAKQAVLSAAYDALNKSLLLEQVLTVKSAVDGVVSYSQFRLAGSQRNNLSQKILEQYSDFSTGVDFGDWTIQRTFSSKPEEVVADKPQEMLLASPEEGTSVLLMIDTLSQIVQQSTPREAAKAELPSYIRPQHRVVLQEWLTTRSHLRIAKEQDCRNCEYGLNKMRRQNPDFLPYYAVGDFNDDGNQDFAAAFIDKRKSANNFVVAVFNGSFDTGKNGSAFFREGLDLSGGGIFFFGEPKLYIGAFNSDSGLNLIPRGKEYAIR